MTIIKLTGVFTALVLVLLVLAMHPILWPALIALVAWRLYRRPVPTARSCPYHGIGEHIDRRRLGQQYSRWSCIACEQGHPHTAWDD